jgi:outer membrane receptor protein involved in Fe transport
MGAFVGYTSPSGWSASWQTTFVSDVAASSELYDLLQLPEYTISTASFGYNSKRWRLSLIVRNVFDERYWVPNNGSFGGMLLQTGLPRNAELSITRNF